MGSALRPGPGPGPARALGVRGGRPALRGPAARRRGQRDPRLPRRAALGPGAGVRGGRPDPLRERRDPDPPGRALRGPGAEGPRRARQGDPVDGRGAQLHRAARAEPGADRPVLRRGGMGEAAPARPGGVHPDEAGLPGQAAERARMAGGPVHHRRPDDGHGAAPAAAHGHRHRRPGAGALPRPLRGRARRSRRRWPTSWRRSRSTSRRWSRRDDARGGAGRPRRVPRGQSAAVSSASLARSGSGALSAAHPGPAGGGACRCPYTPRARTSGGPST